MPFDLAGSQKYKGGCMRFGFWSTGWRHSCALLLGTASVVSTAQNMDVTGRVAAPSMQPVQLGLSTAPGMRPEQLLLALRQRGWVANNHTECHQLSHDIQRLRRTVRRGEPSAQTEAQAQLEIALARQTSLNCAPGRKL
jgi:hypothetical protein